MTERITTEAGRRLGDRLQGYYPPDDYDTWRDWIAAIEAEAVAKGWEKGYGDGVMEAQSREFASIPDYRAKAVADFLASPEFVERLAGALSEGDPDTQYDYGDFANLTTGRKYAAAIARALGEQP